MYKTTVDIFEASAADKNLFTGEPHSYAMTTKTYPTAENINDLLFMAMEVDCLSGETLVEMQTEKDGEYVSGDSCVVSFSPVLTDIPSKYIDFGDKKPHIFQIDKEKSSIQLESFDSRQAPAGKKEGGNL